MMGKMIVHDSISDLRTRMAGPPRTLPNGLFQASVRTNRVDADSVSILLVFDHLNTILSYLVKINVWEQVSYETAAPYWSRKSLDGFDRVLVGTTFYWIRSHRNGKREPRKTNLDNFYAGGLLYDTTQLVDSTVFVPMILKAILYSLDF